MTEVYYSLKKDSAAIRLSGHALFAPRGNDIVCAGISSLCIALKDTLIRESENPDSTFTCSFEIDDGIFGIRTCNYSDCGTALRILGYFNLILNGLVSLRNLYPGCIRINNGISPDGADNIDTSEKTMKKRVKVRERSGKRILLQHFSETASESTAEGESGESQSGDDTDLTEADQTRSPEEEFEELIKGKYSDAFRKRTQGIIDRRFSKMKGYENTAKVCTPLLERLSEIYPEVDKNNPSLLVEAFLEDAKKSDAEKLKKTVMSAVSRKAQKALTEKAAQKLVERLKEDSRELTGIYPDFDLERELSSSPELRQLLRSGVGLRRAYETVNLEKILMSSMRYAALRAGKNAADSLRNSRVQENSLSGNASSTSRTDVNNLTEKDIMKIISEVSRGAKISFK